MTGEAYLGFAIEAGFGMIIAAVVLVFIRLWRGPSLPDRVVALDMATVAIVGFCGLAALRFGQVAFLDVAVALALVGFLATVALARFAERRVARQEGVEQTVEDGA